MIRRAALFLVGVALSLAPCETAPVEKTITGILYGLQGGPSGTGTGEVRLAFEGRIYTLDYQKPLRGHLSAGCMEIGSIWTARIQIIEKFAGALKSVECMGEHDSGIKAAISLVRTFFRLITAKNYKAAHDLFAQAWRDMHPLSTFIKQEEALDVSGFTAFGGGGRCLEIADGSSDDIVRLRAGAECFIKSSGQPLAELSFRLQRTSVGWAISDFQEVQY